jgi:hypothetical protein
MLWYLVHGDLREDVRVMVNDEQFHLQEEPPSLVAPGKVGYENMTRAQNEI